MTRRRSSAALTPDQLDAIVACPLIHRIGDAVAEPAVGRPRKHPIAAHLAFAALIRVWRSGARLDVELPAWWPRFIDGFNTAAATYDTEPIAESAPPISWHHYRRARDLLSDDTTLDTVADTFTRESLTIARNLGLLLPKGPGSLTLPHPTRCIYGDGTVVRPIYRTRRELGDEDPNAGRRTDPDAAEHVRHDGTISGTNFVTICARGSGLRERVVLRAERVPAPGQEAATAIEAIEAVHRLAGAGIQAVVYDGAFQGIHIDHLATTCGLIVVNKVAAAPNGSARAKPGATKKAKQYPLGVVTHRVGRRDCRHNLISHDGAICQADLDDAGNAMIGEPLRRVQVKRFAKPGGGFRFTLGTEVVCRHGNFTVWISPHPKKDEPHNRRPENIRLLPEADPHFQTIYGLRNDSESLNSGFKRTLIVDRAMSLGWRRQLIDLYSYGILTNTVAWAEAEQRRHDQPRLRAVS